MHARVLHSLLSCSPKTHGAPAAMRMPCGAPCRAARCRCRCHCAGGRARGARVHAGRTLPARGGGGEEHHPLSAPGTAAAAARAHARAALRLDLARCTCREVKSCRAIPFARPGCLARRLPFQRARFPVPVGPDDCKSAACGDRKGRSQAEAGRGGAVSRLVPLLRQPGVCPGRAPRQQQQQRRRRQPTPQLRQQNAAQRATRMHYMAWRFTRTQRNIAPNTESCGLLGA